MSELLSTTEAGREISSDLRPDGVGASRVRQLLLRYEETGGRQGLKGRKIGGRWVIEANEVNRFNLKRSMG